MILKETEFDETSDVSDGSSSYNEDEYVAPNNEEDYQQSKRKRLDLGLGFGPGPALPDAVFLLAIGRGVRELCRVTMQKRRNGPGPADAGMRLRQVVLLPSGPSSPASVRFARFLCTY